VPEGIQVIGKYAFAGCLGVTEVTLPDTLTTISSYAFINSSITKINIPKSVRSIATNSITHAIGIHAFANCHNLTEVNFEKGGSAVLTIDSNAFLNCTQLREIELPSTVRDTAYYSSTSPTEVKGINNNVFSGCTSLARVTFDSADTKLTLGTSVFENCTSLAVVEFPTNMSAISDNCFIGSGLVSITIPVSITAIGKNAFKDCVNLRTVTILGEVTAISDYAFAGCAKLINIDLPVTISTISQYAFADCISLDLTIPLTVTTIGTNAFNNWTENQTITMLGRSEASEDWNDNWNANCSASIIWEK
jgi:hypothetical protein